MKDLQDYANAPVPHDAGPRFGWLYLTNVEVAVAVCVPVFMFGAWLGQSMGAMAFLQALGISGAILSLLAGWSSYIGARPRLSTALLVRTAFGPRGAQIVWLILALSLFGWFGVQTELFAKAFLSLVQSIDPDFPLDPVWVTILSGLLMSSTAIIGIKGVGKLAQLSIPLLLGVMLYALYRALGDQGWAAWLAHRPEKDLDLGPAVAAIVGGYSVGAIVMPDVKRFAKSSGHSIAAAVASLGVFYPLLLLLTALTAVLAHEPDFMILLMGLGLGPWTLLILMLATWTTNDVNLYGAWLSLAPLFPRIPRAALTAISGVAGTAIACFGVFENMMALFMLLGVLTTPLLASYSIPFIMRGGQMAGLDPDGAEDKGLRVSAFVLWGVSSFVGFASTPKDQWGLGWFDITTVPGLDSLGAAFLLYGGWHMICNRSAKG